MIRLSTLAWVGVAGVTCAALFNISYEVRRLDRQLDRVNANIEQEQDNIRVLRAEWWYLNQTPRLETLARNLTDLTPQGPDRILANIETLPTRLDLPRDRILVSVEGVDGFDTLALPPLRPGERPVHDLVLVSAAPREASPGRAAPAPAPAPATPEILPAPAPPAPRTASLAPAPSDATGAAGAASGGDPIAALINSVAPGQDVSFRGLGGGLGR